MPRTEPAWAVAPRNSNRRMPASRFPASMFVSAVVACVMALLSATECSAQSKARQKSARSSDLKGPSKVDGSSAESAGPAKSPAEKPDIVAVVNGEPISRNDLGREALRLYGEEVLESLVNKRLISEHCKARQIRVTKQEVQDEIDRMAERFGLPTDQWLKLLKDERGINPSQYAKDIIWPTVALRKLADQRLEVTDEDVQQAYETYYGPSVQTRLIACKGESEAKRIRALALKKPDTFGDLAKKHSRDASASAKGLIQPIRRHMGDSNIERIAFQMEPGEISPIIQVGEQYVILKCESILAARPTPLAQVEKVLRESIRDKKLRLIAEDVFKQLQTKSHVENIFNDPDKRKQNPGVAARINGKAISVRELAEECIDRHGVEIVDGMVSRRLLEQECNKQNIEVNESDMNEEIARAALAMGMTTTHGQPDIKAWLEEVTKDQQISLETYRRDVVWPTAALKKLVGGSVEVSQEDLKKGFESNYGPRVQCRAIVMNNLRRAQDVWSKARDNPTVEFFGELAEKYSIEAASASMQGEVPPIQRHGGQPLMEKEAFALAPGEMSGVVQVGDKYVILFCEGRTTPVKVKFEEVRQEIYNDLHEKKLRLAMAEEFGRLEDASQVDNYLAGTSRSPRTTPKASGALPSGSDPRSASREPNGEPPGQGATTAGKGARLRR